MAQILKQNETDLIKSGAIPPDDFHDAIERIEEVAGEDLVILETIFERLESEASELLVDKEKLREIVAGLVVGHIVLQGPPGTGKSSLARAISKAFNVTLMPSTAHEEWSIFEVIGRQTIDLIDGKEVITPVNGVFTEAVVRCAGSISQHYDHPEKPQATWLLIDELNRAHVDRAFGELFSILGSGEPVPITLPFQNSGNQVLVTPNRFRIIGTINSFDKQFVNSLSQALRRRFTFITIDIPEKRHNGEKWMPVNSNSSNAVREFERVLQIAFARVEKRKQSSVDQISKLRVELNGASASILFDFFGMLESVRYSKEQDFAPHLPIGTAQLIDTIELFVTRVLLESLSAEKFADALDWAVSVKIAPLFEADSVNPSSLKQFTEHLPPIFTKHFSRSLLETAAAGLYYVG